MTSWITIGIVGLITALLWVWILYRDRKKQGVKLNLTCIASEKNSAIRDGKTTRDIKKDEWVWIDCHEFDRLPNKKEIKMTKLEEVRKDLRNELIKQLRRYIRYHHATKDTHTLNLSSADTAILEDWGKQEYTAFRGLTLVLYQTTTMLVPTRVSYPESFDSFVKNNAVESKKYVPLGDIPVGSYFKLQCGKKDKHMKLSYTKKTIWGIDHAVARCDSIGPLVNEEVWYYPEYTMVEKV